MQQNGFMGPGRRDRGRRRRGASPSKKEAECGGGGLRRRTDAGRPINRGSTFDDGAHAEEEREREREMVVYEFYACWREK